MSLFISDAFAVVTTKIGGIMYQLNDDNTAFVVQGSSGSSSYRGDIVLPSTVDYKGITYTVSGIEGRAFYSCRNLTSVIIPNSVTAIGERAFSHCTGLTSVVIPNSVTTIGDHAFAYCISLTSINIPNTLTTIEGYTFYNCEGLASIDIPNSVTNIGSHAFDGCKSLVSLNIPNSVTDIGIYAFYDCTGLTSISISESVTSIRNLAFSGCTSLEDITVASGNTVYASEDGVLFSKDITEILLYPMGRKGDYTVPNSVKTISGEAFSECEGLTSISIPSSVTTIGRTPFAGCNSLVSITVAPENSAYASVDGVLFSKDITRIIQCPIGKHGDYVIPNTVQIIDIGAFYHCANLTSIFIPNSVKSIGSSAFDCCTGLTSISMPNSVESLGNAVFRGCTELTSIRISTSVTSLGESTFYGCTNLASIDIPSSVTSIGNYVFYGCTNLVSIDIPNSVTSIGNYAFADCAGLVSMLIPNSVTSIGEYAYLRCTGLTSINIPNSVTAIKTGVFTQCASLTSITIPGSVTGVGSHAFSLCAGLTDIYSKRIIPATADNGAFEGLGECTLHVPYKATGRYREAAEWSAFSNIVEDLPLISVTKSIEYAGNISGEGSYMPEDKAELTAVPNAGYAFSGWYEDGTLITNAETYTFTVTDNHDFTALFVPVKDENPVSITPSSGEVSFSFTPVDGAAKYTLEVYYDEDMTMLVASATEPVQHSSAKMLRVADTGTIGVGGLDSDSQYYYRITAFSVSGTVLSQYSGSFKTDISTGIGEASVNDGISMKECHDASGRKLSTQTKGLNIIRYSDGTIRKVMVK